MNNKSPFDKNNKPTVEKNRNPNHKNEGSKDNLDNLNNILQKDTNSMFNMFKNSSFATFNSHNNDDKNKKLNDQSPNKNFEKNNNNFNKPKPWDKNGKSSSMEKITMESHRPSTPKPFNPSYNKPMDPSQKKLEDLEKFMKKDTTGNTNVFSKNIFNKSFNDLNPENKPSFNNKNFSKDKVKKENPQNYKKIMDKYVGAKHTNKEDVYKSEYTAILQSTGFFEENPGEKDKNRIQNILRTIQENHDVTPVKPEEKILKVKEAPMVTTISPREDRWFSKGNKNKNTKIFQFPHLNIGSPLSFKNLALKLNLTTKNLYKHLKSQGLESLSKQPMITIDELIIIAETFNIPYTLLDNFETYINKNIYQKYTKNLSGSPILAIVGHIDHGKTSLIEYLTKKNLCTKEAGSITQKVSSYSINYKDRYIRLIDTPGHSVFSAARNLAIEICDIVILIVSASEGVQKQTIDAIEFLQNNNIPFVVAITKIDIQNKFEKIYNELMRYNVIPVHMGGDIEIIGISAKTGENINTLMDYILTYSDLHNFHSDIDNDGWGYILESWKGKMGVTASIILRQGKIKVGDNLLFYNGESVKIRNIIINGEKCKEGNMFYTMEIEGLEEHINSNEKFWVVNDKNQLKTMEDLLYKEHNPHTPMAIATKAKKERLPKSKRKKPKTPYVDRVKEEVRDDKLMHIIIATRSHNEITAIKTSLESLAQEQKIGNYKILTAILGEPTAIDIEMLQNFKGILIAFNIDMGQFTLNELKNKKIPYFYDNVIYNIINQLEEYYNNQYNSEDVLEEAGEAEIVAIFKIQKKFIAGCLVRKGTIIRNQKMQLIRNDKIIGEGKIESLKNEANDIKEAKNNQECGIYCPDIKEKYQLKDRIVCWRTKRIVKTQDGKIISEKYV